MTEHRQPFQKRDERNELARRAQTPIVASVKRDWLARYNTPSSIGNNYGDPIDRSQDLVGKVLLLTSVEPGHSRKHESRFTRWTYQELDVDTGELLTEPQRMLSFAQPILRTADQLAGGKLEGLLVLNPPFVVRIAREGDTVLFMDP